MSEKRFYRASVCGDEGLYDKEDGCIIVNVKSNIDLDDNWNTVVEKLNELSEEKEYFERKKEYFLSKWSIVHAKNIQLRQEIKELKKENEQLKKEYKIAIDEMVTDYKKLEKENEQLRKQLDFYLLDEFEWKEKYGD